MSSIGVTIEFETIRSVDNLLRRVFMVGRSAFFHRWIFLRSTILVEKYTICVLATIMKQCKELHIVPVVCSNMSIDNSVQCRDTDVMAHLKRLFFLFEIMSHVT